MPIPRCHSSSRVPPGAEDRDVTGHGLATPIGNDRPDLFGEQRACVDDGHGPLQPGAPSNPAIPGHRLPTVCGDRCGQGATDRRRESVQPGSATARLIFADELWSRSFAVGFRTFTGSPMWNSSVGPDSAVGVRRLAGLTSGPHPVLLQCLRALHLAHTTRRLTARCVRFAATAPWSACSSPCIDRTACAPAGRRRTGPWT